MGVGVGSLPQLHTGYPLLRVATSSNCFPLQLIRWQEKCSNESETVNWILANTKKCPKCLARIEKNQGCNHMVCKNKGCKKEFCWVCMDDWCVHVSVPHRKPG